VRKNRQIVEDPSSRTVTGLTEGNRRSNKWAKGGAIRRVGVVMREPLRALRAIEGNFAPASSPGKKRSKTFEAERDLRCWVRALKRRGRREMFGGGEGLGTAPKRGAKWTQEKGIGEKTEKGIWKVAVE